ncbi:MAG: pyridoxamine 5'-phosphate oxidase family protein [Pseudomonadota bacterium]
MNIAISENPFHAGELEAQKRVGAGNLAAQVASFIRPYMPQQHRQFYTSLPFLVVSGSDQSGYPWITILEGEDGFITSPNKKALNINSSLDPQDPLKEAFGHGTDIGLLGIELSTRRRNRLSGHIKQTGNGYSIDIRQTFGNCPQYIWEREFYRLPDVAPGKAHRSASLNELQMQHIQAADTMFIGTGQHDASNTPSNGYDASHRGGQPGFVEIVDNTHLRIPDYAGNNFFNTIGNILKNPKVGLLFVDFETGGLLHVSGRAEIEWEPKDAKDKGAFRIINVTIGAVVDRPSAISLRWESADRSKRNLVIAKKVVEAKDITSFYLRPADGKPLTEFSAGQYLPIELDLPQPYGKVRRSYSLSAPPHSNCYRISVKREAQGLVSRLMHDKLQPGHLIAAHAPSGDFVIPCEDCPVVLVSAGAGLTPMMAMLHELAQEETKRPVWFIHGARNSTTRAFGDEVAALVEAHSNINSQIFYSKPEPQDRMGIDYDCSGRVTAKALHDLKAGSDAHYMLCGPAAFVSNTQMELEASGVSPGQIHFETF